MGVRLQLAPLVSPGGECGSLLRLRIASGPPEKLCCWEMYSIWVNLPSFFHDQGLGTITLPPHTDFGGSSHTDPHPRQPPPPRGTQTSSQPFSKAVHHHLSKAPSLTPGLNPAHNGDPPFSYEYLHSSSSSPRELLGFQIRPLYPHAEHQSHPHLPGPF